MKWIIYALAVVLLVLHQDFWYFNKVEPLWLGFLPVGLTYQAAYSIAGAVLMWLLVRFAWPRHLEKYEDSGPGPKTGGH